MSSRELSLLSTLAGLLGRSQSPILLGLLKLLDNRVLQTLRLGDRGPTVNHLTVSRDQELLKVPLDTLETQCAGHRLLHPRENGRGLVAVHVQLAEHGEGHAIIKLAEGLDLVVGAGILRLELVARESENLKVLWVLRLELLVDLLEALELRGEAALGSGVDGEDDLAFQGGEGKGWPFSV